MLTNLKVFIEKLIREETFLRFFNIKIPRTTHELVNMSYRLGIDIQQVGSEQIISTETLKILYATFIYKVRYGIFAYPEVENLAIGILLLRFVYLTLTKNLYIAVCITGICSFAGYLWYGHWMDIVHVYQGVFQTTKYFRQLGLSADLNAQFYKASISRGPNIELSEFYKLPYFIIYKGIIRVDPFFYEYRIDPISMIIGKIDNPPQILINMYYKFYNEYMTMALNFLRIVWKSVKGLASYTLVTRIGKRYCPYFIRWHWTLLYMVGMIESVLINVVLRAHEYLNLTLLPKLYLNEAAEQFNTYNQDVLFTYEAGLIALQIIAACHLVFTSICFLHALCGQYFYLFFVTENTELHIGPRQKNSIYSCGHTSWQDEKEKNSNYILPKLWYGWLGRGTDKWSIITFFQNRIKALMKFISKLVKKIIRKI